MVEIMSQRKVFCKMMKEELDGLKFKPFNSELGDKVYEHISFKAWSTWLNRQTMLINEYQLDLSNPEAKDFLFKEMESFLFSNSVVE